MTKNLRTTLTETTMTTGVVLRSAARASRKNGGVASTRRTTLSSPTLTRTMLPATVLMALLAAGRAHAKKGRKKTCWTNWMPRSACRKLIGKGDGMKSRKRRKEVVNRPAKRQWRLKVKKTKRNFGLDALVVHVNERRLQGSMKRMNSNNHSNLVDHSDGPIIIVNYCTEN